MKSQPEIIIAGAGLAGLAAALTLQAAGRRVLVCEAGDQAGGRVRTDRLEGFRLDRGFQVLLTAYPEARRFLDYPALQLRPFYPGARVRWQGRWHWVADPLRRPAAAFAGLLNPIGSPGDKFRLGWRRLRGSGGSASGPDGGTRAALQAEGYSPAMIERFFRPFLGGVFLEPDLATTRRKFESVFAYFARGHNAVPARGMGEIPRQLAARLIPGTLALHTPVARLGPRSVTLVDGRTLASRAVLVAVEAPEAARLLGGQTPAPPGHSACCLYYATAAPPVAEPVLMLNGDGSGPVNHLAFMSALSADYAPPGRHLLSASVIDPAAMAAPDLAAAVRAQLIEWFGPEASGWRHLRTVRVPGALPAQPLAPALPPRVADGLYRCGDYCGLASLNTALASGRLAAEAILADLA